MISVVTEKEGMQNEKELPSRKSIFNVEEKKLASPEVDKDDIGIWKKRR